MANNIEEITLHVSENSPYVIGARAYVEQTENGAVITIIDKEGTTTATVTNGRGIVSATLNADYTLTLVYTDGTSVTTTSIRGATGESGVYCGSTEPTNPDVDVWIDPTGDPYPMEDEIEAKVDDWLTEHPEATTTVQDGSITVPKFAASVVDATLTQAGHPADAKATGDAFTADRTRLTAVEGEADALDARITNLAQLTEGSTTGDAELIDARVVGSTTYSTLHEAIDTEFTNVKSELKNNFVAFPSSAFVNGSLESGVINTAIKNRVASNTLYSFNYDVCLTVDTGYQFAVQYMPSGTYMLMLQCKTGVIMKAGAQFKIYIRRATEVSGEIADIEEFVNAVHIRSYDESKLHTDMMTLVDDEHNYIKYSDGSKVSSGAYLHTYYIPVDNIKHIDAMVYNNYDGIAALAFFSSEIPSTSSYMQAYSKQHVMDSGGWYFYSSDVPSGAKLIAVTHNTNYDSGWNAIVSAHINVLSNEVNQMGLFLVAENQAI